MKEIPSELNDLYGVTNNTQVIPVNVVVEEICSEHSFFNFLEKLKLDKKRECNAPSEIISLHCESPNSNTSQSGWNFEIVNNREKVHSFKPRIQ